MIQFGVCIRDISQSLVPQVYSQLRSFHFNVSTIRMQAQPYHHLRIVQILYILSPQNQLLNTIPSQARAVYSTSHKQAPRRSAADKTEKDDAIPFLQSQAHKFRVDDAYTVDSTKDRSRQKFALPLGVGIFVIIMYFGFLRDYGAKDQSVMGFLTRDIGDRLPDDVRQRIYSEVDQSKLPDRTIPEGDDK